MVGILIYEKLSNSADVSALVGNNIFPLTVPDTSELPHIVYGVKTLTPDYVKTSSGVYGGVVDYMEVHIEISSMNYKELQDIVLKVRRELESATLVHLSSVTKPITLSHIDEGFDARSRNFNSVIVFDIIINRESL